MEYTVSGVCDDVKLHEKQRWQLPGKEGSQPRLTTCLAILLIQFLVWVVQERSGFGLVRLAAKPKGAVPVENAGASATFGGGSI